MDDRRLALVVAVDRYDHAALRQLEAPAADADALAGVLGDPELGGFEVDVLHNPTSWRTAEQVERVLAERRPGDLVLLHFSCHGLKDDAGELYLAMTNTRPDLLGSTAVDAGWVNRVMQRSRAQRVVLLLDCCYGGAFERGVVARAGGEMDVGDQFRQPPLGGGRGRVVITASTAMEYAFEGVRLTGDAEPSIFTGALVEGIRTGEADRDQDGQVALGELYDYVYDRVREQTPKQTPSKWEFGVRGELYVARNPHRRPSRQAVTWQVVDWSPPPVKAQPSMPVVAEPSAPVKGRPSMPVVAEPSAPVKGQPSTPVVAEPSAPVRAQPSTPIAAQQSAPIAAPSLTPAVTPAPIATPAQATASHRTKNSPQNSPDKSGMSDSGKRLPRARSAALIAGIMAAIAGLGLLLIWVGDRTGGEPRDYPALLAMLPAQVATTCEKETPGAGRSAAASCTTGVFQLWKTSAAMNANIRPSTSVVGSCADTPTGHVNSGLPITARTGHLSCEYVDPTKPDCYYRVIWGVDDLRLTGTFESARGPSQENYPATYAKAVEVLRALPR